MKLGNNGKYIVQLYMYLFPLSSFAGLSLLKDCMETSVFHGRYLLNEEIILQNKFVFSKTLSMKALEISLLSSPYTTVKLKWTGLPHRSYSFLCLHIVSLNKFEDLIWHTVVFNLVPRALFPEVE